MSLNVQQAPQVPSYTASSISVPANIATPQATMDSVKAQQGQLNAVNTLSGGRKRKLARSARSARSRRSAYIRTYKGRLYTGAQRGGNTGGAIVIPQVGSPCSGGAQCAGAQNAQFTAIHNQAKSNSINDAYATQQGGAVRRSKKVRFSHATQRRSRRHRGHRHDQSLTSIIAYNIKKVMRKVFA
jgi:hypothetical protein